MSGRQRCSAGAILLAGAIAGGILAALEFALPGYFFLILIPLGLLPLGRRRAAFAIDGPAFSALPSTTEYAVPALWLAMSIPAIAAIGRHDSVAGRVALVLLAPFVALMILTWWRPPFLTITPEGVRFRSLIRTRQVRWEEMDGPVTATRLAVRLGSARTAIGTGLLRTQSWYIAWALEQYRRYPEHREAIGTAQEHQRLDRALGLAIG